MTDLRFRVLHALKLRGVADEAALVDVTGFTEQDVVDAVEKWVAEEAVRRRRGRVGGYALTAEGRELHATLLAEHVDAPLVELASRTYERFLPVNGAFKQLCTDWQMRAGHDDEVRLLDRLDEVHERLGRPLAKLGRESPLFERYPERFDALLDRIHGGDGDALLKPMTGSYHDVWMELHADLLLVTGGERGERDE